MKRFWALVCAVALLVTGVNFVPQSVKAADPGWFDASFTQTGGVWDHYMTDVNTAGDQAGIWDYTGGPGFVAQYTNGGSIEGFAWKTTTRGTDGYGSNAGEWLETKDLSDIACVKQGGTLVKPTPGIVYNLTMKINYTANTTGQSDVQVWAKSGEKPTNEIEEHIKFNTKSGGITEWTKTAEIVFMPGEKFVLHLGFGVKSDYTQTGYMRIPNTITISEFTLEDAGYSLVPPIEDEQDPGFKPAGTPWTLTTQYSPDPDPDPTDQGSYGWMNYKVDTAAGASKISSTEMKLVNTVGEPEKDDEGHRITDPDDRWWWISASLLNSNEEIGLTDSFFTYTGSMDFYTSKPTSEDCYLYVYVGGTEFQFELDEGWNELVFPEFTFKAGGVKFLYDEMPKGAAVSVKNIEFIKGAGSGWETVPNADPNFTEGPWNMFGNFIDGTGNYGVLQYKANVEDPETYSDYTFRAGSVSGWEAWSIFARLENYCADYLDPGDEYTVTIKLNSSKATVPTTKEDDLDKLLILVGATKYYRDLDEGENTLTLHGVYDLGESSEKHEQIMFEMDGLQEGTELTINDIDIEGPNEGWTVVPNKKMTYAGPWGLYAMQDEDHGSKLAYRAVDGATGLGAYDIKVRRTTTTKQAPFASMGARAYLRNYLVDAKDTKGRDLSDLEQYDIKAEITADSENASISEMGKIQLQINEQAFDCTLQKGKRTYTLGKMTFHEEKDKNAMFELDAVTPGVHLNISKIELVGPEGEHVPNGEAITPEGTPWTLYALKDPSTDKYGVMSYEVEGDPANISSTKITLTSVSGWLDARSTKATLNGILANLKQSVEYKIKIKINIDESKVADEDRNPSYYKKLRVEIDNKSYDYPLPNPAQGTYTLEKVFTYEKKSEHVAFYFDQMLKGSIVSFAGVEIVDPSETTEAPSTEATTEVTTEAPTGETTTSAVETSTDVTTTAQNESVQTPGKVKIKKVFKRKLSAKKLKVKIKKVKGAAGYQIAVFKTKKLAKKAKKALVKKFTTKTKYTIKSKKIRRKKKVYVRARAFVLDINGIKQFGKWGNIKVSKGK